MDTPGKSIQRSPGLVVPMNGLTQSTGWRPVLAAAARHAAAPRLRKIEAFLILRRLAPIYQTVFQTADHSLVSGSTSTSPPSIFVVAPDTDAKCNLPPNSAGRRTVAGAGPLSRWKRR